jgi:hypothetical protein
LLHHLGKDTTRGARGSSADLASVDQQMELKSGPDAVVLTVTRKDGPSGGKFAFEIVHVGERKVPVLVPISMAEYQKLAGGDGPYSNSTIGNALRSLGANGSAKAVTSNVLAVELLRLWGELPKDQNEQGIKAHSTAKRLWERIAKGQYRAYLMSAGGEPVKPYRWYLPEDLAEDFDEGDEL